MPDPAVPSQEFLFDAASFPQCHASTIEETPDGLVAAWFGGTHEGHPDVGIWLSLHRDGRWTPPVEVAQGQGEAGARLPCWNPVLFRPKDGPLLLFYKVGPGPREWWGMLTSSEDNGRTWSTPQPLPKGILGPIKNRPIQLEDGAILCASSDETDGLWRVHFERSDDGGHTWTKTPPLNDGQEIGAIQPSLLRLGPGRLLAVGRTRQGRTFEAESPDDGRTWGPMTLGALPNPNSGTDAITLRNRRHLIVYNPTAGDERSPLAVALSDDGHAWRPILTLEDEEGEEFSYPTVMQATDGQIHVVYTWKRRRIRHAVLDTHFVTEFSAE